LAILFHAFFADPPSVWRLERARADWVVARGGVFQETAMKYVMIVVALASMSIAGARVASAQSAQDFQRYQHSGYGQCVTDEGYGRYGSCDNSGG
jgi:hypothetical protein